MLSRNYQVFTGTQLYHCGINTVDGRYLGKDGLLGMLFVAEPHPRTKNKLTVATAIYGPFFQLTEAQMWCNNLNKLFEELCLELGEL